MGGGPALSSSAPSLPPPHPRSPPVCPDLSGRRREIVKIQLLERERSFLEGELKFIEGLRPASTCCKEVVEFVDTKSDPFIPIKKKASKRCGLWKWICKSQCSILSWICCCSGCSMGLKKQDFRCCTGPCSCCNCKTCTGCCSAPKWSCCKGCLPCTCSCCCTMTPCPKCKIRSPTRSCKCQGPCSCRMRCPNCTASNCCQNVIPFSRPKCENSSCCHDTCCSCPSCTNLNCCASKWSCPKCTQLCCCFSGINKCCNPGCCFCL